jgi:hypothetical protein
VGSTLAVASPPSLAFAQPFAETRPATSVKATSATLNGVINANGKELLACEFEYGEEFGKKGLKVRAEPCPAHEAGKEPGENLPVTAHLTGLSPYNTYLFRVVAVTTGGEGKGAEERFRTPGLCGPPDSPGGQGTPETCNWYENGTLVKGRSVFVAYAGFLTGPISMNHGFAFQARCKWLDYGYVENPPGGGDGVGQILGAQILGCTSEPCETVAHEKGLPLELAASASNLPWPMRLGESGFGLPLAVRVEIGHSNGEKIPPPGAMVVKLTCRTPPGYSPSSVAYEESYAGAVAPQIGVGTGNGPGLNGSPFSEMLLDGTGVLDNQREGGGEEYVTGHLNYGWITHLEVW